MSEVAVVGAGYVGLTTAACLAHLGHHVTCADLDAERVRSLSKGEIPILEEGLPALVAEGLSSGRLKFVVGAADAARQAEFVFLCVQTPQSETGAADLSAVEAVVCEIAPVLQAGAVVVNKSTMPVGSTLLVARELNLAGAANDVGVASNPEFLREGNAVRDFLQPSRVVIGCDDTAVAVRVSDLYRDVKAPILVTDPASAEMIKYASNAFLATKISFINAIANLCEAVNADVREVALGMGYDPRIGFEFLHPGPGYGGSCFPKDTAALNHTAEVAGYDFSLLRGVIDVNRRQHERIIEKVRDAVGGSLQGVTVGVWGLTFKANTDDVRDSPALVISRALIDAGAVVHAYDPAIAAGDMVLMPGLDVVNEAHDAVQGAQVLALLTEWDEFRWLDFASIAHAMSTPRALIDARNLLDPAAMRRRGFAYQGVGR
ncbi:MAG: UDPglucose 6-dehydrogenase [Actinomycetota bacterium]|nr:UDPglucose 6-dehydrogenase [Actinomycetota bacterium]